MIEIEIYWNNDKYHKNKQVDEYEKDDWTVQSIFRLYHRKVQYKHAILLEYRDSKGWGCEMSHFEAF